MKKVGKSPKRIAALLLAVMMLLGLAACGGSVSSTPAADAGSSSSTAASTGGTDGSAAAPSGDPIKIGLSAILTGPAAMEGEHVRNGVEMAFAEKNAAGGVLGRPLELITLDDQKDNTVMVTVANNLVSQGVCSVIGPSTSTGGLAVAQVYIDAKIPFICEGGSPNLRKSVLEDGNEWMFMCRPNDTLHAQASADYIMQEMDIKKAGMLYVNNDFGQGAMSIIKETLEAGGVEFVTETYNAGDADVSGQILSLKSQDIECFIFWADSDYVLVARQAYELGMDMPIVASPGATVQAQRDMCEPEWIEGYIISTDVDYASTEPHVKNFVDNYEAMYNMEADLHASAGYTASQLLFAAIEQAGSDDPIAIRDALATLKNVETPNDPQASVDSAGCFIHQANLVIIDDNKTPIVQKVIRVEVD